MTFRSANPDHWRIPASVPAERRDRLLQPVNPTELASQIVSDALCESGPSWHDGNAEEIHSSCRIKAEFNINKSGLLDYFFNGISGYRAQYLNSLEEGVYYNRYCIDLFLSKINSLIHGDRDRLESSLRSPHAKIWITRESDAIVGGDCLEVGDDECRKQWKLLSLTRSNLVVLGGWITPQQNWVTSRDKKCRSYEIHNKGWS